TQTATACHTQTDKSGHGNRGESFVAVLEESVGVRCRFDENQLRKALAKDNGFVMNSLAVR
ncbi:MAG: hypothetical protein ACK5YX_17075, partial [Planctomyces sp.]